MSKFSKLTDVQVDSAVYSYEPIEMRVPLKFGAETVSSVNCLRVEVTVADSLGRRATGVGETPLSITWGWPSATLSYADRYSATQQFVRLCSEVWTRLGVVGHPIDIGQAFLSQQLESLLDQFNAQLPSEPMPHLAALISVSAFDLATHDAFGLLHGVDVYQTYNSTFMSRDLANYIESDEVSFAKKFPADFLVADPPNEIPVWHLVGGIDPLDDHDRTGDEPNDGYPVTLREWIARDGLRCLKVKLRGDDPQWDYERLVAIGRISIETGVSALSADFNCTVTDPQYVTEMLDRLRRENQPIDERILYVEQPFPYDLRRYRIDVHDVSRRKPLFLDESADDWKSISLGRDLGWTGVALKTCKTQTGALLSLCWAKAHGMSLMVQDLTNPRLAQIPHVRLAAHAGTIMGVESNGMQFYPEASVAEARVHPGVYCRRGGKLDLSTISGPGFGYRLNEISR